MVKPMNTVSKLVHRLTVAAVVLALLFFIVNTSTVTGTEIPADTLNQYNTAPASKHANEQSADAVTGLNNTNETTGVDEPTPPEQSVWATLLAVIALLL